MRRNAIVALLGVFAATPLSAALAQDQPVAPAAVVREGKDERALKLLKSMSDRLGKARILSFRVRSLVPMNAPSGQYLSFFGQSRVVMQRPDRLFVETRGDLMPNDLYFDGKTVTAVRLGGKFYSRQDVPGGTIDALIDKQYPGSDTLAPFVDTLLADSYGRLTSDLESALLVGQSMVGGARTDHLAFTSKGIDWEIWIGVQDSLPRRLIASYRSGERQPTFTVEFSDWKLDTAVPAGTFKAPIAKDAVELDFKLQGLSESR